MEESAIRLCCHPMILSQQQPQRQLQQLRRPQQLLQQPRLQQVSELFFKVHLRQGFII